MSRYGYCRNCRGEEPQELNDSFRCGECAEARRLEDYYGASTPQTVAERVEVQRRVEA